MFQTLSERLGSIVKSIGGRGRLTDDNIRDSLREVRVALLEADVALPVVKTFIDAVRTRAIGRQVAASLSPGQVFIKIVRDELTTLMGGEQQQLNLNSVPPAVILMAGLQGAGKTTTAAKLATYLHKQYKKKVMLASCDVYRPAAIEQLALLAQQCNALFHQAFSEQAPVAIAQQAIVEARKQFADVVIVDTAGRLHIDQEMMNEARAIAAAIKPVETLFVMDCMIGQDAVHAAKAFNDTLALTGVILTKTDGDARGGAALSVRQVTGKPIKFLGVGEKLDRLEVFYPERMASRILGMGDMLSVIEEIEQHVDREKTHKLLQKTQQGKTFNLQDLREQLHAMQGMGGLGGLLEKIPGMGQSASSHMPEKQLKQSLAIIDSMTLVERKRPDIINGSRKRRIAQGSGNQIQDVNRLLKQQKQMSKMMKKFSKGGIHKLLKALPGKRPPGALF